MAPQVITEHDPGDEDDRDDERIVAAVMKRSMPVATSKRILRRVDPATRVQPSPWTNPATTK